MRITILLYLLILAFAAVAQQKEPYFLHYNSNNGLPYNNVQSIAQDSAGFIWLGTSEGLVKYDGYRFRVFRYNADDTNTLSCNNITAVLPISSYQLLIGTYDCGLNIFNTQTNRATRIYTSFDNRTLSLFKDKQNRIWMGLNDGSLNIFDVEQKKIIPVATKPLNGNGAFSYCHGFAEHRTKPNQLWIATLNGLVLLNKTDFTYHLYRYADYVPKVNPIFNRARYPIHLDDDNVWMGSWGGGVSHYIISKNMWENFLIDSTPPLTGGKNIVLCTAPKNATELWVATVDSGLGVFNTQTRQYIFFDVENNQKTTGIRALKTYAQYLYTDAQNNLWAGFQTGLVTHSNAATFEKYGIPIPTKTNLKNLNYPFYFLEDIDRNGIWVAPFHGDGLYFYDNITQKYTLYPPTKEELLPRGMVWSKNRQILLLTANAFWKFDPDKKTFTKAPAPDTIQIEKHGGYQLLRGKNSKIYIGTSRFGVYEWNEGTNQVYHYYHQKNNPNSLLQNGPIYALCIDTLGNLWVGMKNGITVIHNNGEKYTHLSYTIGTDHKAFKDISSITTAPDGTVWMQSVSSGLLAVNALQNYKVLNGFDVGDGLLTNTVYHVCKGPDSLLLIYTSQGLQFFNPITRKSHFFSTRTDFPFKPSEWGALQYVNGQVFISTFNGFYKLGINHLKLPTPPKQPTISHITVFEKEYPQTAYTQQNINFTYKQNFIRIYFTNFDYANTKKTRLSYIIKGLSPDTLHTEKGVNDISLTGLAAGTYELAVWINYPESGVSSSATTIKVVVSPPWWQTWWFIAIVIVTFLLIIYVIYGYRLKQARETSNLKRKLAEMENIALRAQMNPHFLFNSLNSVNYYIQNNETAKASQHLKKFSKLVRIVLNNSRNNTVTLEDELEALKLYLEFEEVRFDNHFSYQIHIAPDIHTTDIIIPPLLLQPYVENAIWHGVMQSEKGGAVTIRIAGSEEAVTFVIEDNGIGREKASELKSKSALKHKSHGMDITNERVRLFNVTHTQSISTEIIDLYNEDRSPAGTRVVITYKQQP
ncbi:MAG: hypothetical protein F9K23_09555 [Bacteroidetes bacterium]|nr:MAG: hypothetical protein F9K23_09555 [Bacteroidota bacterium]